jgi:hypothetical protein
MAVRCPHTSCYVCGWDARPECWPLAGQRVLVWCSWCASRIGVVPAVEPYRGLAALALRRVLWRMGRRAG